MNGFLICFFQKKAKLEKLKAAIELNKANQDYLEAKKKKYRYLSKYSGRKRYQKA